MNPFLYSHLEDGALRRGMVDAVPRFHLASATAIAYIAEFDARRLYLPEAYPSMAAFCTGELGLSEQVAKKLIRVGRTALRFPEIFLALAEGRLNATAVIILAPWLTRENAAALLAAAAEKSNDGIRELLADRVPKLDVPLGVAPVTDDAQVSAQTPAPAAGVAAPEAAGERLGDTAETSMVSAQTPVSPARPGLEPLGAERFAARFTMCRETHDAMRRYEELLGRTVTSDEMDEAARRGLEAMIAAYEKRRFAATGRPQRKKRPARGRRPAAAERREVAQRDAKQCTFVSADGRRCTARAHLEYDHVDPVARGGGSGAKNLRLFCRAHNQYVAEQVLGRGFMAEKRERARRAREARKARKGAAQMAAKTATQSAAQPTAQETALPAAAAQAAAEAAMAQVAAEVEAARAAALAAAEATAQATGQTVANGASASPRPRRSAPPRDEEIIPCLRQLGFRADEARRAAEHCATMTTATLEQRVRAALSFLAPRARVTGVRSVA